MAAPPEPETAPGVPEAPLTPEAPPEAPVAQPVAPEGAPVAAAPVDGAAMAEPGVVSAPPAEPVRTGPRVLEAQLTPEQIALNERIAETENQRIAEAEAARARAAVVPQGKNRTPAEVLDRQRANEVAPQIAERFLPSEIDHNSYLSKKPADTTLARTAVMDRAKSISTLARAAGFKIPRSLKDNTNADLNYNNSVGVIMEADRLANLAKPTKKDYQRFLSEELRFR